MAKIIQLHPEYRAGMPVKLWVCNVANGDYPQELANILNAPVIAADAYTYYPFDEGTPMFILVSIVCMDIGWLDGLV